jgi:archaellum component FlaC
MAFTVMVMEHCPDCERLERKYRRTISEIYAVVDGKFNTVREKLRELARWQDVRDEAVEALYEHKKTHAAPESSRVLRNVA